jgi:hypothetical protein
MFRELTLEASMFIVGSSYHVLIVCKTDPMSSAGSAEAAGKCTKRLSPHPFVPFPVHG